MGGRGRALCSLRDPRDQIYPAVVAGQRKKALVSWHTVSISTWRYVDAYIVVRDVARKINIIVSDVIVVIHYQMKTGSQMMTLDNNSKVIIQTDDNNE
jgi:hypothetical protein